MSVLWLLGIWTAVGLGWWVAAVLLVRAGPPPAAPDASLRDARRLSVFKPLATPVTDREFARLIPCLDSFAAELDASSEMLIGCHDRDRTRVLEYVKQVRRRFPHAEVRAIVYPEAVLRAANPKIACLRVLAAHASGELWFWSDADIVVPRGTMESLRRDYGAAGGGLLTCPYVIRQEGSAAELLDTLFVNLEFYPGVILLGRCDRIDFGFGSGLLFAAEDFHRRADWNVLTEHLADDFHLGRSLSPARLASTQVRTVPAAEGWIDAILHYLRWQKTIRWCRPGPFAAQLVVLPALGWLAWIASEPSAWPAWLGLGLVLAGDAVSAGLICRTLGCPLRPHRWYGIPVWSLIRALSWVVCWLPWPVVWRGRRWWSPRLPEARPQVDVLGTQHEPGLE